MDILSELRRVEKIEDAYINWAAYREAVTAYILAQTTDFEEIAVFGAGRCNDINLAKLAERFERVILLDKDREAMQEALEYYQLEQNAQIQLIEMDFLGVSEDDFRTYAQLVRQCFTDSAGKFNVEPVISYLDEAKHLIKAYNMDLAKNQYKNIILIGVHSQLNIYFAHIWSLYSNAFKLMDHRVHDKVKELNEIAARKLNHAVIQGATKELFIGFEAGIMERPGKIEGAVQAENDLKNWLEDQYIRVKSEFEYLWPFKSGCTYQMKVICINEM